MNKLSKKQKGFSDEFLETGNGVQSALKAYDTDNYNSANQIAIENLQKPTIIDYIKSHANNAVTNIIKLSNTAENETVRLNANKDILDRAGYKAIDKQATVNTKGEDIEIQTNLDEIVSEVEAKLKANKTNGSIST